MQPPPRKGKATSALRNVHNDQLIKLQMKHQQDVDFLDDIRNFTKLRSAIEKEYAQALLKLATTYLQKKLPTVPEVKRESGESYKTIYAVWKTMLDETEKIAKARLAAAEVYQQQVSESAKSVRMYKLQVAKKCFENLRKMHDEIQQCVVEIDKTKKLYFEEEHMAHEARDKAHDADEKLKRKKGRIFQSISSLQKNSAKFSFRKEACDIQATKARNDYVLALLAANAHQSRFHDVDLPELIQLIDCDIYDKVKEYILLISRTELLTCAACQSSFNVIQEQANMATRQYTTECFFHDNPVLSQPVKYDFDPCDNDQITKLSIEHNAGLCLSKEAKRWATCLAKETRVIRDSWNELNKLQSQLGDKPSYASTTELQGPPTDIEIRIDELKHTIRRAETSKQKAEARLEALRDSGVNVDEWIRTSDTDSLGPSDVPGDLLSRSGTVTSRTSQKSFQSENFEEGSEANDSLYDSDYNEGSSDLSSTAQVAAVSEPQFIPEIASAVDVVAAIQSAWDEAAEPVEEVEIIAEMQPSTETQPVVETQPEQPADYSEVNGEQPTTSTYVHCIAVFSYQATNSDELSFVEQEELELIGEGDGEGWVKAKNYRGEEGFIPQNYVEIVESQPIESSRRPPLTSFSSVDYSVPNEELEIQAVTEVPVTEAPVTEVPVTEVPVTEVPVTEVPVTEVPVTEVPVTEVFVTDEQPVKDTLPVEYLYCQALYDYEATCDEELTFNEGQIIKILRRVVHDVDDGWWEGEIEGSIGLFPSLVVEELKDNGEPRTPVDGMTPTESAPPPAYTPPKPQFLVPPSQVILTQPTPEIENAQDQSQQKTVAIIMEEADFQLELPEKQAAQYQTQFSASDSESSEHEVPVTEDVGKYAPLVSSPDSPTRAVATALKEEVSKEAEKEKKVETDTSQQNNNECPTVVITEPQPGDSAEDYGFQEESPPADESSDFSGNTYRSADDFETTFTEGVDESAKVASSEVELSSVDPEPLSSKDESTLPENNGQNISEKVSSSNQDIEISEDIPAVTVIKGDGKMHKKDDKSSGESYTTQCEGTTG